MELVLHYRSQKSPMEVFKSLADMNRFVRIHPAIYKAVPIGPNEFQFFEKVKVGFFHIPSSYRAVINSDLHTRSVHIAATVQSILHVSIRFAVKPEESGSSVEETIEISGPAFIGKIFAGLLTRVHRELMQNLEEEA